MLLNQLLFAFMLARMPLLFHNRSRGGLGPSSNICARQP
uniref:Uncharacterized protein n=1 Tax=Picea glauca TaxID=3330 RepID=A0A101LVL6_PICGL|nr:hypothetical protein ABT39_MTgene2076 [Picea glauca]QHR87106.1 hypothetical protein Q903MT_gene1115 [Picea sitchensis]